MKTKHIWKGSVGCSIEQKTNSKTRTPFYTIRPVRCFKRSDDHEWEYVHDFAPEQLETLLTEVIPEAKAYRDAAMNAANDEQIAYQAPAGIETGPVPLARINVVKVPASEAIQG